MAEVVTVSSATLEKRVEQERLRLARRQLDRIPLSSMLIDAFLCWMLVRVGLSWAAFPWLGACLWVQGWRWRYLRRFAASDGAAIHAALERLGALLVLLGVLRCVIVPVLFWRHVQAEHYMFTMVYVGMASNTSPSAGGQVKPVACWALLACGGLALAWMFQRTADGVLLGLMIVSLIAMLIAHVRDQSEGLRQYVKLACDNELLAESLRKARDMSEAASLSKTRFFAAASHDLRQPLHALSINATTLELLATRQADPLIKELSHGINRALNQSNSLLDSLLDISNLDADAVKPRFEGVHVGALLGGVLDEFLALAGQKGLALRVDVADGARAVRSDPDLLRRIVINLVGNAVKFTSTGSVALGASVVDGDPGKVCLFVSDTGVGIAFEEQERVFEEFYQIGNISRDRSKGLGLGLSIVRRTAALLGAGLRLRSAPGRGTRIELILERSSEDDPVAAFANGDDDTIEMLPDLCVLVVDDEEEILRSMHGLLTQLGCAVRCASGGAQALERLDEGFVPQVLVVDHRLRDESGTDVIGRLRARLGPVAAVLVTGDTEPATLQLARSAGHRLLHKPVRGHLLGQVLLEAASDSSDGPRG